MHETTPGESACRIDPLVGSPSDLAPAAAAPIQAPAPPTRWDMETKDLF
jgi:hypothetical protein